MLYVFIVIMLQEIYFLLVEALRLVSKWYVEVITPHSNTFMYTNIDNIQIPVKIKIKK